jgi:hypothetical protein
VAGRSAKEQGVGHKGDTRLRKLRVSSAPLSPLARNRWRQRRAVMGDFAPSRILRVRRSRWRETLVRPFASRLAQHMAPRPDLWLISEGRKLMANDRKVEGFRASSDVRKPYMQEPAVGSLCAMGISDSAGAGAVLRRLPERMR